MENYNYSDGWIEFRKDSLELERLFILNALIRNWAYILVYLGWMFALVFIGGYDSSNVAEVSAFWLPLIVFDILPFIVAGIALRKMLKIKSIYNWTWKDLKHYRKEKKFISLSDPVSLFIKLKKRRQAKHLEKIK